MKTAVFTHGDVQMEGIAGLAENYAVFSEVIVQDTYGLRKLKEKGFHPRGILDIGGHIGTFSVFAATLWPNARIATFEPDKNYFAMNAVNVARFPNVLPVNAAVIGFPNHYLEPEFQDGDSCWRNNRRSVGVREAWTLAGAPVDLVKIDVEGAEVEIFHEMEELGLVDSVQEFRGEFHFERGRAAVFGALTRAHVLDVIGAFEGRWNVFHASRVQTNEATTTTN